MILAQRIIKVLKELTIKKKKQIKWTSVKLKIFSSNNTIGRDKNIPVNGKTSHKVREDICNTYFITDKGLYPAYINNSQVNKKVVCPNLKKKKKD